MGGGGGGGVVVGGGGGVVVVGEHCCTLSGQQSLLLVQTESHQQPEGAFPPQLPRQVSVVWPSQLYILLISVLSDSVKTLALLNRSQVEGLFAVML